MHVKRVIETASDVVDWVFAASLSYYWEIILLVIEVHRDGSTVDVFWTPST